MEDLRVGLLVIGSFWGVIYLVDYLLRRRSSVRASYLDCLRRSGVTVSAVHLRWFTTGFNRWLVRVARSCPGFLTAWFSLGVVFGLGSMVVSVGLLLYMAGSALWAHAAGGEAAAAAGADSQMMVLVLPGVNLPYSQVVYMFVALLSSAVVHEAGHAVAAVLHGVRLNGFGLFLVALYPGAFVDLATDSLMDKTPLAQLRIYCAGVWHNFVLLLFSWALLLALPVLLSPLYATGVGVAVQEVDASSPLYSPSSFPPGTVITEVNRCTVSDTASWAACVSSVVAQPSVGFCIDFSKIPQLLSEESVGYNFSESAVPVECCSPLALSDLCFTYTRGEEGKTRRHSCLATRPVLANFECNHNRDCYLFYGESSTCLFPSQVPASRLFRVSHSHSPSELLYIGDPYKFSYAVSVSDFVPSSALLPRKLPDVATTLLKYVISFSAALALLNVVPCYTLDGQWVISALLDWLSARHMVDESDKENIKLVVLSLGSILLLINICIAFINMML